MYLDYDFQLLSDKLIELGAVCSVAELQGMICGQLACGKQQSEAEWLEQAREFSDLIHFELTDGQQTFVRYLLEASEQALNDNNFAFQPLLPDDACPLADRSRELGLWCRGFLHGFGVSGIAQDTELPAEVVEVVRDLAKMSETLSSFADGERDSEGNGDADTQLESESDADWFELVEYLRTAVFTVKAELGAVAGPASPTLN